MGPFHQVVLLQGLSYELTDSVASYGKNDRGALEVMFYEDGYCGVGLGGRLGASEERSLGEGGGVGVEVLHLG